MLTLHAASVRMHRYLLLQIALLVFAVPPLLVFLLKPLVRMTTVYMEWPAPFAQLGWAIQYVFYYLYKVPLIPSLWSWMPAMSEPWALLSPKVVACFVLLYISGLALRGRKLIHTELSRAHRGAQQALWQAEILGTRPMPHANKSPGSLGTQMVAEGPWSARPWGIVVLSVAGGVISGVLTQWLNIAFGLAQ